MTDSTTPQPTHLQPPFSRLGSFITVFYVIGTYLFLIERFSQATGLSLFGGALIADCVLHYGRYGLRQKLGIATAYLVGVIECAVSFGEAQMFLSAILLAIALCCDAIISRQGKASDTSATRST